MSGSDEEGDFTLDIHEVRLEDDAMFQCQVGAAPGVAPVRSRYARLTVTVRPEQPIILQGSVLRTQEDRVLSLECISRGGKPAPEVSRTSSADFQPHPAKMFKKFCSFVAKNNDLFADNLAG